MFDIYRIFKLYTLAYKNIIVLNINKCHYRHDFLCLTSLREIKRQDLGFWLFSCFVYELKVLGPNYKLFGGCKTMVSFRLIILINNADFPYYLTNISIN